VGICHCRHCQKQSGAPFSVVWAVAESAFAATGAIAQYADSGDSGQAVYRQFCGACGSPIRSLAAAMPGVCFVKAGTLDAPGRFAPTFEVYCARGWPWLPALAAQRHPLALGDA